MKLQITTYYKGFIDDKTSWGATLSSVESGNTTDILSYELHGVGETEEAAQRDLALKDDRAARLLEASED